MANAQKTPISRTLNLLAQRRALDEIEQLGYALAGHVVAVDGPIVTVNFDVTGRTLPQVTMPIFGAEYVRLPVQIGDKGCAFPAAVYLGGVSGLGNGVADTTRRGNLATLVWFPIGNKEWSSVDPNAVTLYGPNGVVLRDSKSKTTETLTPTGITVNVSNGNYQLTASGTITLQVGSHSVVINSSGVTIDGVQFLPHTHSPGTYVAPSGGGALTGDSGSVVA